MKKIAQSTKSVTKPATTKKTPKPNASTPDAPIPFKPTRTPLEPITGSLTGAASPARFPGGEVDRDLEAERTVLRSTVGEGDRWSLVDLLLGGLTGTDSAETPLDLATEVLEDIGAELRVLSSAIGAHDVDLWPYQATADRIARRAEMVADLAKRIDQARSKPAIPGTPPAYEIASALLTMPGVLEGAPDAWERLQRIAERLDVALRVDDAAAEARLGLGSAYMPYPRVKGGPNLPCIFVKPGEDKVDAVAHLLGYAVARREGFDASPEWCNELAAYLLGGHETQKGAA